MLSDLGIKALDVLSPLILVVLGWLALKSSQLIAAKVRNEYLRGVLARLDDAVFAAVREVEQTYVATMKAAGSFGKPAQLAARDSAIASVKSHLGAKGLEELASILGLSDLDLNKVLSTRVEATVNRLGEYSTPLATSPSVR